MEKYVLYFKGKNKYGHEHYLPIIEMDIRLLDEYICNYDDYIDLYKCLPKYVRNFIENNICVDIDTDSNESLKKAFLISNDNAKTTLDFIFYENTDVLYINNEEIKDITKNLIMTSNEYKKSLLKSGSNKDLKAKYIFFTYVYDTFVKGKRIKSMIDTYDIKQAIAGLDEDKTYIGALATDKDNIVVLLKKLEEKACLRRDYTLNLKKLYISLKNENVILDYSSYSERKNKQLDIEEMNKDIISNLKSFVKKYNCEYK